MDVRRQSENKRQLTTIYDRRRTPVDGKQRTDDRERQTTDDKHKRQSNDTVRRQPTVDKQTTDSRRSRTEGLKRTYIMDYGRHETNHKRAILDRRQMTNVGS
ncbi:hypothetical protein QAD02_019377 [Eretmocerus hayati]|uniref:Uncharacterized protein n=1 Tax=Eretmocerus hayati TaxID=131215 RepID=A0ACC2PJI2_9HYME|nr:hypothetical protein QAD02_019377 [Eretmocerus hayati]